ncbi:MAG: hypothetical protein ABJA71_13055 [Ginsengibacter sp.]
MIRSLRRRHFQIWIALAILLPAGIVIGAIVIPKPAHDKLLQPGSSIALPVVLKSIYRGNYTVNLRSNEDLSTVQLEWINKDALIFPSALIYKVADKNEGITGADIIGRIESRGTYHFALKPDSTGNYNFKLYDFIHQQIIDSITLKTPLGEGGKP